MIGAVDHVKHDGARTEVEGDIVTDPRPLMARNLQAFKSTAFDLIHANLLSRTSLPEYLPVSQQLAGIHDRAQVVNVRDVVDLGIGGRARHECP
jgi:hypothetical protein